MFFDEILTRAERFILLGLSIALFALVIILVLVPTRVALVIQPHIESVSAADILNDQEGEENGSYINEISLVPAPILQSFIAHSWTFSIDEEFLRDLSAQTQKFCGGATDYTKKQIYVQSPSSVLHEFGHYLTYALNWPERHTALYLQEAKTAALVLGSYSATNSREYFAEYFAYWITNRENGEALEILQKISPETYSYFMELEAAQWGLDTRCILFRLRSSVTAAALCSVGRKNDTPRASGVGLCLS